MTRVAIGLTLVLAGASLGQVESVFPCWPAADRGAWAAREAELLAVPNAERLLKWHEMLASEPHVAGSPGDLRTVDRLAAAFTEMGYEVEKHQIWPLLARPISCAVEIVAPERITLAVKEAALTQDAFSAHPDQMVGWNAYSGSGDVIAGVVYANYGTHQDFAKLKELGVSPAGRIVIVRYGGNFRGFKVKYAQEAGAAGVIIYSDPADSGYVKGIEYPEGGYANSTCIERGSIVTMPYAGDPLTPFVEATQDAQRQDPAAVDIPRIPVQPVGWATALEILQRMKGEAVPQGWQGGLPLAYRLSGGPSGADELKVRLKVEQKREVMPTFNVIATLKGEVEPDRLVIVGCHHDAWNCGAADPLAGMISLLEAARAFSEATKQGWKPARTLVFCGWAAEEFGLIGSTEWVEGRTERLSEHAVAYLNLDMASMGPDFQSSAAPSLRPLIADAARAVPAARDASRSVFQAWLGRSGGEDPLFPGIPRFGEIGGGSDHVGFWCHLTIPSAGLSGGGSKGTSYHSTFDTLPWYWKTVGTDYEPALMVARMTTVVAGRLATAPLIPLNPVRYGLDTRRHLIDLTGKGAESGVFEKSDRDVTVHLARLDGTCLEYAHRAAEVYARLLARVDSGTLGPKTLAEINAHLLTLDRAWFSLEGLPDRPWFRNLYAVSDDQSGYASDTLPLLRAAVEVKDKRAIDEAAEVYLEVFRRLQGAVDAINERLEQPGP